MNIASLISGGVDSSVTLHLLWEQGIKPDVFYIKIGMEDEPGFVSCPSDEDIEIVTFLAKKYGCRMEIVSLQEEYWDRVISYTIESVKAGLTPNPDIMCNKLIKFGSFNDKYGDNFDFISTGHYADTTEIDGIRYLSTAADKHKDQTYFLGQIDKKQLNKVMFPIGRLQKKEVREIALKAKLPSATRPDSQGICFLGKINYNEFIRRYVGEKKGPIVELETGRILGEHNGFWFHTIGQRKGLGLGQGPWFVVKKNIDENIVYVSNGYEPESVYHKEIPLSAFRFISENPYKNDFFSRRIAFKIRHTPIFTFGTLSQSGNIITIHSETPIHGVAAGQYAVIYDEGCNLCLGSGIIVG